MERRLAIWLLLVFLLFYATSILQQRFNPKPIPKEVVAERPALLDESAFFEKPADEASPLQERKSSIEKVAVRTFESIGSLDPKSGHAMLVTLDPLGGSIRRIELGSGYYELNHRGAYVGQLCLAETLRSGLMVKCVGPGTPAAEAKSDDPSVPNGLKIGDRLVSINGAEIFSQIRFDSLMDEIKPGAVVAIVVERRGEDSAAPKILTFHAKTTRQPLELIKPESNRDFGSISQDKPLDEFGPNSLRLAIQKISDLELKPSETELQQLRSLHESLWEVERSSDGSEVAFSISLEGADLGPKNKQANLKLTKRFTLEPLADPKSGSLNYHIRCGIEIANRGEKPVELAYRLEGPNGLPTEGWWYTSKAHPGWFKAAGARDVLFSESYHQFLSCQALEDHARKRIAAKSDPVYNLLPSEAGKESNTRLLRYLGIDTQYFGVAFVSQGATSDGKPAEQPIEVTEAFAYPLNKPPSGRVKLTNVSFAMVSPFQKIAPKETLKTNYTLFAGPKDPRVLERYGLSNFVEYGWFGSFSRLLRLLLEGLYWFTGNYGLSLILLTVSVRLALLPISLKSVRSSLVMQALAPELKRIKEAHPEDMVAQSKASGELYKRYGINHMAGCLPMFLQLPILLGLYRCISVDIDLRDAPLVPGWNWASNLAGPDFLFEWKNYVYPIIGDEAAGYLGPFFNVLPLFTMALFMIQQKIVMPPPTDEQMKLTQNITNVMSIFIMISFYRVPAGLCIYFITTTLWSLMERLLVSKPDLERMAEAARSKKKSGLATWLETTLESVQKPVEEYQAEQRRSERAKDQVRTRKKQKKR